MGTDRIQSGLRLRVELLEKITYIAKKEHRSLNSQIECLVERCIKEYEKENGDIPPPWEQDEKNYG